MCAVNSFNRRYILQFKIVGYELNIQHFHTKGSANIVDKKVGIVFGSEVWSVWCGVRLCFSVISKATQFTVTNITAQL